MRIEGEKATYRMSDGQTKEVYITKISCELITYDEETSHIVDRYESRETIVTDEPAPFVNYD